VEKTIGDDDNLSDAFAGDHVRRSISALHDIPYYVTHPHSEAAICHEWLGVKRMSAAPPPRLTDCVWRR